MRITTQGEYGIRCMVCIAKRPADTPVSIQTITDEEALPKNYAEQLLLRLRRGGLIRSVRGAKGGYMLSRNSKLITLKEMLIALEGSVFEIACDRRESKGNIPCAHDHCCSLNPIWHAIRRQLSVFLDGISLFQLVEAESESEKAF